MDWFFDQWVHGVDIPRYRSDLKATAAGNGEYRISGVFEQAEVSSEFRAILPIYADFGKEGIARIGALGLLGNSSREVDFTIGLPKKPKRVLVNAHHDVLARN